jgi:hypothetical protein
MCKADVSLLRSNERRRTFPSMATTLTLLGEPGHKALKRGAELRRIELAEQPAERVMAGHAVGQL